MYSALINNRLKSYLEENELLSDEQMDLELVDLVRITCSP